MTDAPNTPDTTPTTCHLETAATGRVARVDTIAVLGPGQLALALVGLGRQVTYPAVGLLAGTIVGDETGEEHDVQALWVVDEELAKALTRMLVGQFTDDVREMVKELDLGTYRSEGLADG